jgi:uncharacterized FAD-dependent dehydrogenase
MPLRVTNLRLGVDEPEAALATRLAKLLGLRLDELGAWRILRKSLDARDKDALQFVYHAEVRVAHDEARIMEAARRRIRPPARIEPYQEPPFQMPAPGKRPLERHPVVIG